MRGLQQFGRRAVARSSRPFRQAACAHAVPQAVELTSTSYPARSSPTPAALPWAPFRSQHTKVTTVKRGEKGHRLCEAGGCDKSANFGNAADSVVHFCAVHKKADHVNVRNKMCEAGGCDKSAVFGSPVDRVKRFCGPHKGEGHVNVVSKRCEAGGCDKFAVFGSPVDRVVRFCGPHKGEGHVNVVNKRCQAGGCDKYPVYGSPVDRVKRFCTTHKKADHVNVQSKMCEADGCDKHAAFGSEAEDLPRFCKPHSLDGDVLLQKLRCVAPGCDGPRSWGGTAADGVALHCKEHRGEDFASRKQLRTMARARADTLVPRPTRPLATRAAETALPDGTERPTPQTYPGAAGGCAGAGGILDAATAGTITSDGAGVPAPPGLESASS